MSKGSYEPITLTLNKIVLSFLNGAGVLVASDRITQPDITIGIPALLIDIEMACFAVLHIFAYPIKEYKIGASLPEAGTDPALDKSFYQGGPFGIKAYADAFNPWDIIKAIGRGFKWAFVGRRTRENDPSYQKHLDSTPLQDGLPLKGRYEQLDDSHADDDHFTYDAFSGETARPGFANNGPSAALHSSHYNEGPTVPAQDGFAPISQHEEHPGVAQSNLHQDTAYAPPHTTVYGQSAHVPGASQYQQPYGR